MTMMKGMKLPLRDLLSASATGVRSLTTKIEGESFKNLYP